MAQITTIALNARRHRVLKKAVSDANLPIVDLGYAMGEALGSLQLARQNELLQTAQTLSIGLGPGLSHDEYSERVKILDEKVTTIETLRKSNPRQAAQEMVAAHEQLNEALSDDSRQRGAVADAVTAFVDNAEAVRAAFASGKT